MQFKIDLICLIPFHIHADMERWKQGRKATRAEDLASWEVSEHSSLYNDKSIRRNRRVPSLQAFRLL